MDYFGNLSHPHKLPWKDHEEKEFAYRDEDFLWINTRYTNMPEDEWEAKLIEYVRGISEAIPSRIRDGSYVVSAELHARRARFDSRKRTDKRLSGMSSARIRSERDI